jgi:tRNA(fMet)-specific endonuclease VapC
MKGLYHLQKKFDAAGNDNCFISEITLAELKFGVENSQAKEKNTKKAACDARLRTFSHCT